MHSEPITARSEGGLRNVRRPLRLLREERFKILLPAPAQLDPASVREEQRAVAAEERVDLADAVVT